MRVGLALGGGGAKGFFHLGVLSALEKMGIKVDVISGTSMGALVGALYSFYGNTPDTSKALSEVICKYNKELTALKFFSSSSHPGKNIFFENSLIFLKEFFLWNLHIMRSYLIEPKPFLRIFKELFKNYQFSQCKIPFCAVSVDVIKGEEVLFNEGALYKGVIASCAFPGLFPPLRIGDKLFIDGAVLSPMPIRAIKSADTFVIGVNLEDPSYSPPRIKNAMDVLFIADKIRYKYILEDNLRAADFVISPHLQDSLWLDFGVVRQFSEEGEKFTLQKEPELRKALERAGI